MESTAIDLSIPLRGEDRNGDRDEDSAHAFLNTLEEAECIHCEEPFSATHPATILPGCRHVYGIPCLTRWVMSNNRAHNRCPICRDIMFDDGKPITEVDEQIQRERQSTNIGTSGPTVLRPTQPPPNRGASFGHTPGFAGSAQVQTYAPRHGSSQLNPHINYSTPPPGFRWPPAQLYGDQDLGEGDFGYGVYAQGHNQAFNAPSYRAHPPSYNLQAMPNSQTSYQAYQPLLNQERAAQLLRLRTARTAAYGVPVAAPNPFSLAYPPVATPQAQSPWTLHAPTSPPNNASQTPRQYPNMPNGASLMSYLTQPHGSIHPHPAAGVRGAWPYEYPAELQGQLENVAYEDPGLHRLAHDVVARRRAQRGPASVGSQGEQGDYWMDLDGNEEFVRRGLCGE